MGEQEKLDVEFEVKETIEEGKHAGTIDRIDYREINGYRYLDIYIATGNYTLRAGFPANISKKSMLGKLLERAGMELKAGKKIKLSDIQKALEGRKIEFLVSIDDEGFARVVRESIKFVD